MKDEEMDSIVLADIAKIDAILKVDKPSLSELLDLHRDLDGKYRALIDKWEEGCVGYAIGIGLNYEDIGVQSAIGDLKLYRGELRGLLFRWNIVRPSAAITNIITSNQSQSSNTNIEVSFEQAVDAVDKNSSFSKEDSEEIKAKIQELEDAVKSSGSKKIDGKKSRVYSSGSSAKASKWPESFCPLF